MQVVEPTNIMSLESFSGQITRCAREMKTRPEVATCFFELWEDNTSLAIDHSTLHVPTSRDWTDLFTLRGTPCPAYLP